MNPDTPVVGRINFATPWTKTVRFQGHEYSMEGQVQALALGLDQLAVLIQVIDGRLTEMQKQMDKIEMHTWRQDKP